MTMNPRIFIQIAVILTTSLSALAQATNEYETPQRRIFVTNWNRTSGVPVLETNELLQTITPEPHGTIIRTTYQLGFRCDVKGSVPSITLLSIRSEKKHEMPINIDENRDWATGFCSFNTFHSSLAVCAT